MRKHLRESAYRVMNEIVNTFIPNDRAYNVQEMTNATFGVFCDVIQRIELQRLISIPLSLFCPVSLSLSLSLSLACVRARSFYEI